MCKMKEKVEQKRNVICSHEVLVHKVSKVNDLLVYIRILGLDKKHPFKNGCYFSECDFNIL